MASPIVDWDAYEASIDYSAFVYSWPYLFLTVSFALVAVIVTPHVSKLLGISTPSPETLGLWRFWWLLPVYMLHQFEEHGIDVYGRRYAFRPFLCTMVGQPHPDTCLVTPAILAAINVGAVYIIGALSGLLGSRRPLVTACAAGLVLVNALLHIFQARNLSYNPGLLSACLLFLPLSLFSLRHACRFYSTPLVYSLALLSGLLTHAVLFTSIRLHLRGLISESTCIVFQVLNGFAPLMVLFWNPVSRT